MIVISLAGPFLLRVLTDSSTIKQLSEKRYMFSEIKGNQYFNLKLNLKCKQNSNLAFLKGPILSILVVHFTS